MFVALTLAIVLVVIGIIVAVAFPRRAVSMALALVVVGSVAFHFWTPWWWTEVASNWGNIDGTII